MGVANTILAVVEPETTALQTAQLMRRHHVGALVVVGAGVVGAAVGAAGDGEAGAVWGRSPPVEAGVEPALDLAREALRARASIATATASSGMPMPDRPRMIIVTANAPSPTGKPYLSALARAEGLTLNRPPATATTTSKPPRNTAIALMTVRPRRPCRACP